MNTRIFLLFLSLLTGLNLFSQTYIFRENFDSYDAGTGIASQSSQWQTWNYTPGNPEDALVSGEHFSSGDKSLHIINDNDILYGFGNRVSGAYIIAFNMFVVKGNGAYLNVEYGNRTRFAFSLLFDENEKVWIQYGTDTVQLTTFLADEWFNLKLSVDLNNDTMILYKNDAALWGYDFTLTMSPQSYPVLGCIDFYGLNNFTRPDISNADFYIDDFDFIEVTAPEAVTGCDFLNYMSTVAQSYFGYYMDLDTSGSVISTAGNFDDANSGPVDIGFTFKYNCQEFTQFILNTNGFIRLGDTPPSSPALFYSEANGIDSGIFSSRNPADVNLIIPFNHDLAQGTGVPEYRVSVTGDSAYRICTIQFRNLSEKTTGDDRQYDNIEFQIKLYETSNFIEFVYGDWIPSANPSAEKTAACGLKGSTFSDEDLLVVSKRSESEWANINYKNAGYDVRAFNFGNPPDRPKPMEGWTYLFMPAFETDLIVNEVYALGTASRSYGNPQHISASIGNMGLKVMSDVKAVLKINGANDFADTATIPFIQPKTSITVSFDPFSPENLGKNIISVRLPDDDESLNNEKYFPQELSERKMGYATEYPQDIDWGYAANRGGILLAKYHVNGSAYVSAVDVFITNYTSIGLPVYAVIMDESGTITGQSDEYIIEEAGLYSWISFDVNDPPRLTDADFYAGLAVPPAEVAYYPLGVQVENPCRTDAYFWSPIGGGSINKSFNRFMIAVNLSENPDFINASISPASVRLFPNPATDLIHLSGLQLPVSAAVWSSNGVLLKTKALDETNPVLTIDDLPAGLYILRLQSQSETSVTRFIKK